MLTAVSPTSLYAMRAAVSVPSLEGAAQKTLSSQSSVPVVDRSKYTQQETNFPNNAASTEAKENSNQSPFSWPLEQSARTSELSDEAKQVINQLKARDAEVRAHEMAHQAAAGGYASGGISYSYQVGPDGRRYAIGGEVGIDTSPIPGDPEATLQKALIIQSAALAPANPSAQDMRVASSAIQMANQARVEIATQKMDERVGSDATAVEEERTSDQSSVEQRAEIQPESSTGQPNPLIDRNGFDLRVQLQQIA